jgi:curved DNA-binding protein CbpA
MNRAQNANHYELLGVPHDATCHQVSQLRRSLSRRFHTDNGAEPDGELMARINHAIDVLGDRDKRRKYDDALFENEHRQARVEAEKLRQARAQEVRAEDIDAFAAALEGNRSAPASSVAPPTRSPASAPLGADHDQLAGAHFSERTSGSRPWQALSRRPGALRRRVPNA